MAAAPSRSVYVGVGRARYGGKDTTCGILAEMAEKDGLQVVHGRFGRPVRRFLEVLTGIDPEKTFTLPEKAVKVSIDAKTLSNMSQAVSDCVWSAGLVLTKEELEQTTKRCIEQLPAGDYTVGRLLQLIGTEIGRKQIRDDIWILIEDRRILVGRALVLFPDARFPNELAYIREKRGLLVYVDASRRLGVVEDGRLSDHASETSVSPRDFSVVLDNNGTLEKFKDSVRGVYAQVLR